MADKPDTIQDRYAFQFAADLEKNVTEQQELQARLDRLRTEEEWLRGALGSLPDAQVQEGAADAAQLSAQAPAAPEEAPVPQPRQEEAAPAGQAARTRKGTVKKTAKAAKKTTAKAPVKEATAKEPVKKTAKKAAAKKTAAGSGEPTLGDLLLSILAKQPSEPRTAGEVAGALEQAFPERARDINTVRNTLERLVAKSRVERTKQGSTVYYTAVQQAGAAAQKADTTASAAAESAGSPASDEAEKVGVGS
ncbi:BlaI/MecI/CopY family transcriptional regulator [Streptomyces sp. NPDC059468]|uniref:BlaI/MecI/CopY family transcriptional regulator n=1 Tax=unclassified Streptomyces TaxID=2593676 RepID=UPI0036CB6455